VNALRLMSISCSTRLAGRIQPRTEDHTVVALEHMSPEQRNVGRQNIVFCMSANALRMAIRTGRGIGPMSIVHGDREAHFVRCFPTPKGSEMEIWFLAGATASDRPEVRSFMPYSAPPLQSPFREWRPAYVISGLLETDTMPVSANSSNPADVKCPRPFADSRQSVRREPRTGPLSSRS
jgi:hypothetical protein